NETRRTMRDIGSNVKIIPKDADDFEYFAKGYSTVTMSEEVIHKMAEAPNISYNHLIAMLTQEITLEGRKVRLVGLSDALHPPGRAKKSKMGFSIKEGHIYLGHRIGRMLDTNKNEVVEILGRKWTVERIEPEKGTDEDITIFAPLGEVQAALKLSGGIQNQNSINEIQAIDCLCLTADKDPAKILRAQLSQILPEAKVIHLAAIADARARQRQMEEENSTFIIVVLIVVSGSWLGILAAINVRERRGEIGLLRALGYGSTMISSLVLGRAALIGIVGALLGYGFGCLLAIGVGPDLFPVTAKAIKAQPLMLLWALLGAPMLTMLASFIPASLAVSHDPAIILHNE
ncbi:MAG: FtsX-like permease family protein, partial [Planctomycetales bacterium]